MVMVLTNHGYGIDKKKNNVKRKIFFEFFLYFFYFKIKGCPFMKKKYKIRNTLG